MAYILNDEDFPQSGNKRKNELWLVNTDGSNNKLMYTDNKQDTNRISNLYWSPDSQYLIFSSGYYGQTYKISVVDSKQEKVNIPTNVGLTGWFSNNKLGFTKTDTGDCLGECYYQKVKALLMNPDGTAQEEVYTPKEKELVPEYYWLYSGKGIIRELHEKRFYYDFTTKKETQITETASIKVFKPFPKSNKAAVIAQDGGETIHIFDFDNSPLQEKKVKIVQEEQNRPREVSQLGVSNDEKYFLLLKSIPNNGMNRFIELLTSEGESLGKVGPQNDISILGFIAD